MMPTRPTPDPRCPYCRSGRGRLRHRDVFHKVKADFGPFSLYDCAACGSCYTANPPSAADLARFYADYQEHRPDWYSAGRDAGALSPQYRSYAAWLESGIDTQSSWLDIGVGHGEVANLLQDRLPQTKGAAIDIAKRPAALASRVTYTQCDLNADNWTQAIEHRFDHVFAVAVWEHAARPDLFARQALSLVAPGGRLTLICPDYGSMARRVLNRHWPFFQPGEHLTLPTQAGARTCLQRAVGHLALDHADIRVRSGRVRYSLRYLLHVLRMSRVAALFPPELAAPLPTGILLAQVST